MQGTVVAGGSRLKSHELAGDDGGGRSEHDDRRTEEETEL